jgi:hypothetical protein
VVTVESVEHKSQVGEVSASRDAYEAAKNAERLAAWKARYPRDAVEVPACTVPPSWPAFRASLADTATVTPIRKARGK